MSGKPPLSESTEKRLRNLQPYKPGAEWNGNSKGRPKGSRHKLTETFLAAMVEDFDKAVEEGGKTQGQEVIARVREEDPSTYLRVIAAIIPKQVEQTKPLEDLNEEQLDELIAALESQRLGGDPSQVVAGGEAAKAGARRKKPPNDVPPLQ